MAHYGPGGFPGGGRGGRGGYGGYGPPRGGGPRGPPPPHHGPPHGGYDDGYGGEYPGYGGGYGGYGGGGYGGGGGGDAGYGEPSREHTGGPMTGAAAHGFDMGDGDEAYPRTIYVGNLDPTITEDFVYSLFGQIGAVSKCKVLHEPQTEPYAFVEFADHNTAAQALIAMNKRVLFGKEMKVNWATQPGTAQRVDTSKHFHVFVGDLSPEVDNKALKDAFIAFGECSDAKVIRDLQTLKSKGYGFVSYIKKEDAERAIEQMNGQWLGRRTIRTNWATRKPTNSNSNARTQTFDEVYNQTSPSNMTVYVGGVGPNCTEEEMRKSFAKYGTVVEVRVFKQQGYAFIRFDNKESAAHAIVNLNGTEIGGQSVRCSWGRQNENQQSSAGQYGYGYGYGGGGPGGAPPQPQGPPPGGPGNQQAWNQYWQQYYQNPAMMAQWQNYWQGQ